MNLDMFAENLILHYEKPHNKGRIDNASVEIHEDNPTCGDDLTMYLKINKGKIEDVKFEGIGCSISIGTSSILTDYIKGKKLEDVRIMRKEDIFELIGITPGPGRVHCATLSLRAIRKAILKYGNYEIDRETKEM